MRRDIRRRCAAWALAVVVAAPLAADGTGTDFDDDALRPEQTADEWEQSRYAAERVEARVKLFGTWYENYFRVPDDEPATTVNSLSVEGRVTLTLHRERRIKMYLQAIRENFQDVDILTSPTYSIGFRADGERHGFDAGFRYLEDREQLDIDDLAEPSDIYIYYGAYSLRFTEDWEWALDGELRDQRFPEPRRIDNSELYSGSTSIRYRGWGRRFSPEIGYESRRREAVDPHDDYDETMPWIKLRFSPFPTLTASLRFRDREREYSTGDPDDSNFRRVDERDEWTLRADWVLGRRLALNLEAERLESRSTRESRNFTSDTLVLGTTIKVGPMRGTHTQRTRPPSPPPVTPPAAAAGATARASAESFAAPDPAPSAAAPAPPPLAAPLASDTAGATAPDALAEAGEPVAERASPPPIPATERLLAIEQVVDPAGPTFVLRVAGEHRLRSFALREPHRFVVDLEGVVCNRVCGIRELGSGAVIRVRSAQFALAPRPVVRVVFDLRDAAARGTIVREGERVVVSFPAAGR
jgi:hypothetical protein